MNALKIFFVLLFVVTIFSCVKKDLTYNEAKEELEKIQKNINWTENFVNRKANIDIDTKQDINSTLPDISKFPITVDSDQSGNIIVEIFVSTEKAGKGTDGWLNEVATDFNNREISLSNGKKAKVRIRSISSGTGVQFIVSEKYIPDAFSPSNDLWIKMIDANNIKTTVIDPKLAGNVAGIVIKDKIFEELKAKYGTVDLKSIVNATIQGDLAMGYTNPFASSTGLNFLMSVLYSFANGDKAKMLSDEVSSAFQSFQQGVPFVSFTTIQMRDSVEKGGSLDAFVLEYQTFLNTKELKTGYAFIPFGVRHDNPLYAIGDISDEKIDILKKFASFVKDAKYQKLAKNYGFNSKEDYKSEFENIDGSIVLESQKLWKEKKDSGRQIAAVFLCDISGSMDGEPLMNLKKALFEGSKFINKENSIGLTVFNSDVTKLVPIKKFNYMQQASFIAGVEDMVAGGSTAMYDGIMVSLKMLMEEKEKNQNIKPMLFVLTDGETNWGLSLNRTEPIIRGLKIPIYTIGYNADIEVLKNLSSINEAASINAETDDVIYKIGALLNSQM